MIGILPVLTAVLLSPAGTNANLKAREERAGKRPSGYAAIEMVKQPTPAPVVDASVINAPRKPLKPDPPRAAAPADVRGKTYDLVIFGGTPGGIAMAVRAAREGLNVLLVNRNRHLGGILSSGLRVWDTLYEGKRSPIYDEARQGIFNYYRETYGERSAQYRRCLPGKSGHTNGQFEPAVAEHILTRMVNNEPRITVLCDFFIADAERDGALLKTATFRHMREKQSVTVSGKVFADCSYEGDLAAVAKVPYRVGRESREEFGEPHAGVVYMGRGSPQTDAERRQSKAHKKLNLRPFRGWQNILPGSTGKGDFHVQAFNYRTILTDDPANRLPIARPDGYDRDFIAGLEKGSVVEIPNRKFGWNRPQVVGPHDDYVEGDWVARRRVMDEHWQATLAMLYFLQNDESVPPETRKRWKPLGLAVDEFPDNGHRPYEIYVREARRIVGRYVFTQHDGSLPADIERAPVHPDSVGINEWYFDSHACTKRRVRGSLDEGKHMLHENTFPGQVPYRSLLPKGLDNLLVPVCLSSTHVAWGTIRLEPTWMNLAESAAYAAGLSVETGVAPSDIDSDALLRRLAEARVMITFFNDLDLGGDDPRIPAAQYFGTKGFFPSYDARLDEPLTEAVQRAWAEGSTVLREERLNAMALARKVRQAEAADSPKLKQTRGEAMLSMWRAIGGGIDCQPIRYSNMNLKTAPLPSLGAACKFADWDGGGLLNLLWLSHPRYNDDGAADAKPNIVFIVADDMGYGDCGVHGCRDIPTPNIDALARSGIRFTDGYVTGTVCSPTRAALMTGRYHYRDGVMNWIPPGRPGMNADVPTVAGYLKQAGYRTALIGKWHLGEQDECHPLNRGFDEFYGFLGGSRSYWPDKPGAKAGASRQLVRGRQPVVETEYTTYAFGREGVKFIERQKESAAPFFLHLAFNAVHCPMDSPPELLERFSSIKDKGRRTYAGMLTAMDEAIGRVLKAVHDAGLDDRTLICFISDNGGPTTRNAPNHCTNTPLRGSKGETWEGGIRVPFFMKWTGHLPAGSTNSEPVIQMDITATALALAGVKADPKWPMDGVDLMPFLKGDGKTPHETLFWSYGGQWAIRKGRWKLTYSLDRAARKMALGLYDLNGDIGESNDLSSREPERVKQLQAEWDAWWKGIGRNKPQIKVNQEEIENSP